MNPLVLIPINKMGLLNEKCDTSQYHTISLTSPPCSKFFLREAVLTAGHSINWSLLNFSKTNVHFYLSSHFPDSGLDTSHFFTSTNNIGTSLIQELLNVTSQGIPILKRGTNTIIHLLGILYLYGCHISRNRPILCLSSHSSPGEYFYR